MRYIIIIALLWVMIVYYPRQTTTIFNDARDLVTSMANDADHYIQRHAR